jgi:hypothetical protein
MNECKKRINESSNLKNNQSRVLMSARSAQSCSTLSRGSKKAKEGGRVIVVKEESGVVVMVVGGLEGQ